MGWAVNIGCGKKPTASAEQSSTHSTREDHDRRSVSDVDKPRNTENHAQVYFSL